MDAASMEEESSDRSIQPASPDEQQSSKKEIQGGCQAHLSILVLLTHHRRHWKVCNSVA